MRAARRDLSALSFTIVGSILAGCASAPTVGDPQQGAEAGQAVKVGVYAPAALVEPFVPAEAAEKAKALEADAAALELDALLSYAEARSPAIQTARAKVGLADAEIAGAEIWLPANPQISFGGGARTVAGASGFEFEVAVQQRLEIAGQPGLRLSAAEDARRVALATVNEVRWQVHVEVHRLFVQILLVRERLEQAERFVAFSTSLRDIAARQVEAGAESPLVLLVADADLARTREAVIEARQGLVALRARLAAVIGWPEAQLPPVTGSLPGVRPPPPLAALLEQMVTFHPSLRARELAVQAGQSRLSLAQRMAWPSPSVGVSYGREASPASGPGADIWLLNLSVPIPLWRQNQQGQAEAQAQVQIADRDRLATFTALRSEVAQAASALQAALERVSLYEESVVPQLERSLALLQRAYELGEVSVHQVSQTRERLLNATGQYIDARITYYGSAAVLEGLIGTEIWPEDREEAP